MQLEVDMFVQFVAKTIQPVASNIVLYSIFPLDTHRFDVHVPMR